MDRRRAVAGAAAMLLLAGCGATVTAGQQAPMVTVTGRFVRDGGPLGPGGQQPAELPLAGRVVFTADGHRVSVRVGRSGRFTLRLPPGIYTVSGRSPSVGGSGAGATREPPCSVPSRVTVTAGHRTRVTVRCIVP